MHIHEGVHVDVSAPVFKQNGRASRSISILLRTLQTIMHAASGLGDDAQRSFLPLSFG